jgi:phenylacetate-CoA oxygenase PaaI subunit
VAATVAASHIDTRTVTRDLILLLADSKRLLGMRYAGWILGAPELEAGIACASMAQDEWGHGRLLYSLLREFDEDVDRLEHGRAPAEYWNLEALDRAPDSWPGLVALNALADTALTVQLEALRNSRHAPLRQRVEKMIEEERFHAAHGNAWLRRLARGTDASQAAARQAVEQVLPGVLRWFGPDSPRAAAAVEEGIVDASGHALRERFAERIVSVLEEVGGPALASTRIEPDFAGFDEASRRVSHDGPDAETIEKVRGDRNRVFLMD